PPITHSSFWKNALPCPNRGEKTGERFSWVQVLPSTEVQTSFKSVWFGWIPPIIQSLPQAAKAEKPDRIGKPVSAITWVQVVPSNDQTWLVWPAVETPELMTNNWLLKTIAAPSSRLSGAVIPVSWVQLLPLLA